MSAFSVTMLLLTSFSIIFVSLVLAYFRQALKYRHIEGINFVSFFFHGFNAISLIYQIAAEKNARFVKWFFPLFPGVIVTHPDSLKWVLSNPQLFPKSPVAEFECMSKLFDYNIVNANGDDWQYVISISIGSVKELRSCALTPRRAQKISDCTESSISFRCCKKLGR
jgi:hypothetical protein